MFKSILSQLEQAKSPSQKAAIIADKTISNLPEEIEYVARGCVVFHWFNEKIIEAIMPIDATKTPSEVFNEICNLPFIDKTSLGAVYHDLTRQGLIEFYAKEHENLIRQVSLNAGEAYLSLGQDRLTLTEAFYCLSIAGDPKAKELLNQLLRQNTITNDPQFFNNITWLKSEIDKFSFTQRFYIPVANKIEEPASEWFLKHPYPMPPNFTGRVAERKMLTDWLTNDESHPLLILRALGGFGKSSLTWHWLTHDVDSSQWRKVAFWSFYEGDASFDNFLKETLQYFGVMNVEQLSEYDQTNLLLNYLKNPGILLILDGFERVLRAYGSMSAAYQGNEIPKDDSQDTSRDCINIFADAFLKGIVSLRSKVLMTTRLTPRAVEKYGGFLQGVREEELNAMHKDDAVEFFHVQGIRGTHAEIEAACEPYGYHPLSLRLLAGRILKDFKNPGDIAAAQILKFDGDIIQQKHHVLEVSYNSLPQHEQRLLSTIACFRVPAEFKAIEEISSYYKTLKSRPSLQDDLFDLIDRGLLHFDSITNKYDLHPIVRRYAYDRLMASDRTSAHNQLANYFESIAQKEKIETLEDLAPIIELYHHMVRAGKLDEAWELFYERINTAVYYQFGAYQLQTELLRVLFPDGEDNLPRLKRMDAQAWTLNALSQGYGLSGQPLRATLLLRQQIVLFEKLDDKRNLAVSLGNACDWFISIGALVEAEKNLHRSIDLCREIGDEFGEAVGHRELGRVLSYRGAWQEAEQELDNSRELAEKQKHVQMQGVTWSYRAIWFLLMAREEAILDARKSNHEYRIPALSNVGASAIEDAKRALKLADEQAKNYPVPRDYIRAYWLLGSAYHANNELTLAEENLSKALNLCRQINMVDHEADILLDVARLRYAQGDFKDAQEKASEALVITERSGYVLQGADVNLFLAQYALEQEKDKAKAKEYALEARKLATGWEEIDGKVVYDTTRKYVYKVAYDEAEQFLARLKE